MLFDADTTLRKDISSAAKGSSILEANATVLRMQEYLLGLREIIIVAKKQNGEIQPHGHHATPATSRVAPLEGHSSAQREASVMSRHADNGEWKVIRNMEAGNPTFTPVAASMRSGAGGVNGEGTIHSSAAASVAERSEARLQELERQSEKLKEDLARAIEKTTAQNGEGTLAATNAPYTSNALPTAAATAAEAVGAAATPEGTPQKKRTFVGQRSELQMGEYAPERTSSNERNAPKETPRDSAGGRDAPSQSEEESVWLRQLAASYSPRSRPEHPEFAKIMALPPLEYLDLPPAVVPVTSRLAGASEHVLRKEPAAAPRRGVFRVAQPGASPAPGRSTAGPVAAAHGAPNGAAPGAERRTLPPPLPGRPANLDGMDFDGGAALHAAAPRPRSPSARANSERQQWRPAQPAPPAPERFASPPVARPTVVNKAAPPYHFSRAGQYTAVQLPSAQPSNGVRSSPQYAGTTPPHSSQRFGVVDMSPLHRRRTVDMSPQHQRGGSYTLPQHGALRRGGTVPSARGASVCWGSRGPCVQLTRFSGRQNPMTSPRANTFTPGQQMPHLSPAGRALVSPLLVHSGNGAPYLLASTSNRGAPGTVFASHAAGLNGYNGNLYYGAAPQRTSASPFERGPSTSAGPFRQ